MPPEGIQPDALRGFSRGKMRALLVEDSAHFARALRLGLRHHGFAVDIAANREEAMFKFAVHDYDVVILDLRLPDGHGLDLCRWMRERDAHIPILILTALDRPEDIVTGLNAGADDYVVKPVDLNVLAARLQALLRRARPVQGPVLQWRDLRLDPGSRRAWLRHRPLELRPREFDILEYLMRHAGRVVTPEELMEHVWGEDIDAFSNVVRVYIHNLRRKLGDSPQSPQYIVTVKGRGYLFGPREQ